MSKWLIALSKWSINYDEKTSPVRTWVYAEFIIARHWRTYLAVYAFYPCFIFGTTHCHCHFLTIQQTQSALICQPCSTNNDGISDNHSDFAIELYFTH